VTDTATHVTRQLQFRYPLAGIGEILVDEGSCSWRQTAEYIYNFQKEGVHAMILHTDTRTQRARLGPHTEANSPEMSASDD